ncbi:MAG: acyl-CoA dehydrogenase [Acidobacteria bacterium]|nr:MAG: acyl-CoA dehydrogenase [Acidobacteriota bacterium]PYY23059.1 MAG: acyl-CoA dehydrogenase [Acidobacteriota bacterium]
MATAAIPKTKIAGGSFLIEDIQPEEVFTPEDFTDEHRQIAQTTEEFALKEIVPNIDKIEHKDFSVSRDLIKKASELGLTSVDIPEEYGGMEMDKVTSAIIADYIAKSGSFSVTWGAHVGIGTLPIVYFGTPEQKQRYLPKLASGEWVGAYALSESSSGSDALNCRTRADLSSDGKHYILNGEKMWITNASFADLYVIFAKVGGEKFSAFVVERTFPGFSVGAEEKKLGIRGSSTCPLILNDCKVPVGNLLGEIGKGHVIAFNILNIGRFKLGAGCVGGARTSLLAGLNYAKQRKAFGKALVDFGLIREKLADVAIGIYVGESLAYRTVGMIDEALRGIDKHSPDASTQIRKGIEEYAVECSILKVWGSEMLDQVVDHVVQIYGGYGFVEEYPAERAYRDSRVNRIFEGTNEINRMIITGWLMKRAMSGQLALMPAIKKLMDEVLSGPSTGEEAEGDLNTERALVANAKKVGLFAAGVASQRYMMELAEQQEVMAALADIIIEVFAMDSVLLRTLKLIQSGGESGSALPIAMTQVYLSEAMAKIEVAARKVVAAASEGDNLRIQTTILRRLLKHDPTNTISLRQQIAARVIDAGKYVIA